MSLKDDFVLVLRYISGRKLRSWLTILGVVIGVASIVALVSVSQSLQASVEEQFEAFGTDKVMIYASSDVPGFGTGLNEDDVDIIDGIADFEYVSGILFKSCKIEYKDEIDNVYCMGFPSDKAKREFEEFGIDFDEGRAFETDSNKVVIGPRLAYDVFEKKISVKNKIEVEGEKFEVVGIVESLGNPEDDSNVYMPLEEMRDLFKDEEGISYITAKVKPGIDIEEAAEKVKKELKKVRSEESFDAVTADQLLEQMGAILDILQVMLVGIATISLVVGSVGIANSMYTSVLERVKDIGIMKAVGAPNHEIIAIFLIEASLIGFVGGIIGVAFGTLIAFFIGVSAEQAGFGILKVSIESWVMAFGLAFAVIIGMISGFMPARKAAKLKPVDALKK
ncbi:hypothetical protein CMO88_00385 [Candidatus Woesearchaeota archaeon]|nr:hypothetical protein [Candidatus Woesearchaeota archaeon]|tara:strand:+ start:48796 stop:49974 length:1179 start_codon:yes stop_codon:yes gene_type:complete